MFKSLDETIGEIDLNDFSKRKKMHNCSAIGDDNHKAIYQEKGELFELKGFLFPYTYEKGMVFDDGSRLLIKGWLKIIRVGDFYQLFPLSDSFGFCHSLGNFGLSKYQSACDQEKLANRKCVFKSYLVDDERNIAYEVEESVFDGDAKSFDLFNRTKQIVLFNGEKEVGFVDKNGKFYPHCSLANIKVDPITKWWLSNN